MLNFPAIADESWITPNQNSNLSIPQPIQNQAVSEIGQLFNQAVNHNVSKDERASSFNGLLIRCPPGSEEASQLQYLQTKAEEDSLTYSIKILDNNWQTSPSLLSHERLPTLLNFTIYFSRLSKQFLNHYLCVDPDTGNQIVQNLVDDGILRDRKSYVEIRNEPRRVLLENQGGYQQNQLNEALFAYFKWLRHPAFDLKTEGEGCRDCIASLYRDCDLATLWNQALVVRVEVYVRSAQWLNQYAKAPEQAVEAYQTALTICPEGRRKEEIQSELRMLFKEQTKKLKPSVSEAPQQKTGGGFLGMFKRNN